MDWRRHKILFILHSSERSGAPQATVSLARILADRGHSVTLCFPERGGLEEECRREGMKTIVVLNPVESLRETRSPLLVLKRFRAFVGYWRAARGCGCEVAWVSSLVAVIPAVACWLAGLPVIHHIHEPVEHLRSSALRVKIIRRISSAIVFVGRQGAACFRPRPRGQRWLWLPNPVDPRRFGNIDREATRLALSAGPEQRVVLAAAFLSPRKGIDTLIRAFARVAERHRDAVLWIAGAEAAGLQGYGDELERLAQKLGLHEVVRFLGHRDDVARLMVAADLYVLPSRAEAQPVALIEAMMAGLPVIATRVGSVPEMVADGESGKLIDVDDEQGLASAMMDYLGNPELAKAHAKLGQSRALERYKPEAVASGAEKILETVRRKRRA